MKKGCEMKAKRTGKLTKSSKGEIPLRETKSVDSEVAQGSVHLGVTIKSFGTGIDLAASLPCTRDSLDETFQEINEFVAEKLQLKLPDVKRLIEMANGWKA